jgi:hypothetical protein
MGYEAFSKPFIRKLLASTIWRRGYEFCSVSTIEEAGYSLGGYPVEVYIHEVKCPQLLT